MAKTNPTLGTLIELARDGSAAMPERHQAFEEIVRRFEHLVAACAYARLRDPALAEDAAQDTFLLAWQCLDQLREPAAFPGWIRRLVLTQCHRRLRGTRLELRPKMTRDMYRRRVTRRRTLKGPVTRRSSVWRWRS